MGKNIKQEEKNQQDKKKTQKRKWFQQKQGPDFDSTEVC